MNALASLRGRLAAALAGVFALGMAVTALSISTHAASVGEVLEDSSLQAQAEALAGGLRFDATGRARGVSLSPSWRRAYARRRAAYAIYAPGGGLELASTPPAQAPRPLGGETAAQPLQMVGPRQDLALSMPAPHGRTVVVTRLNPAAPHTHTPDPWENLYPVSLMSGLSVLGLGLAFLVAGWSLRPLRRVTAEAAAIGPDRPDLRLHETALPVEVRPLARTINQALDRVAVAYAAERRFTADAAHALRTPLSVLDLRLQRAEAGAAVDWPLVRADLGELSRIVTSLLTLSRADRGAGGHVLVPLNLARLVRETAAAVAPSFEAQGRTLELAAPATVTISGDAGALGDLLRALLDNALTHGAGGVAMRLVADEREARITVRDEGAGVREADREAMFERFRQKDVGRGGAGLGLAIVRQTARNHGGDAAFAGPAEVEVRLAR